MTAVGETASEFVLLTQVHQSVVQVEGHSFFLPSSGEWEEEHFQV